MNQSFPTLKDFSVALAMKTDAIEIVKQPLYDFQVYPTAGIAQLTFFQNQVGTGLSSSPGNANAVKQLTDTNMQQQGQLPAPQAFWINSIECDIQPGSSGTANTFAIQIPSAFAAAAAAAVQAGEHDLNALYLSGSLTLNISNKNYYQEGPLCRFPTRSDFRLDTALATTSGTAGEIAKAKMNCNGEKCAIVPGIGIMTSQAFNVQLNWPAVVATPSTFNARIGVIMRGWLFRAVQ